MEGLNKMPSVGGGESLRDKLNREAREREAAKLNSSAVDKINDGKATVGQLKAVGRWGLGNDPQANVAEAPEWDLVAQEDYNNDQQKAA